jgi:eukaryotic-like serine/threonine-protein kinase
VDQDIDVNLEPLPGYRLIERLGAGGYGEVWRAEAPGGLTKAIKFVFGKQHEKRASNELRAMDHVRGVRHPFLLSLERIEVVDGRLLIVTELADKSVKDRFDACRREGLRGIPRDELLNYLRDAADALDFMSDTHTLQHLDIKPENLLLLAGHVKVADFGLVKDVRQSQASLVGGMTPLYAAPEVFRGTPSRHSDQYSLAIVFQEMLSGTLPFAGSNAAELTLQHLNDEPNLSAVAASDRYALSRALSKDPEHRFPSCRELVEALIKAGIGPETHQPVLQSAEFDTGSPYTNDKSEPAAQTEFFDEGESEWESPDRLVSLPPVQDCRIIDMPPIDFAGRDVRPSPTLVLGIGGTAGRVVSHLRHRIHEQFAGKPIPAIQFLLLDSDSRAQATEHGGAGLTPDEFLALPLRRPQHYRDNSQQLLHWLSRRWLYNIPRSLRTEGLRPLGRLALADHARQAGQRIRRAMLHAIDAQSIADAAATTGQAFRRGALRVVVVASISGGTGGGMSLDIGYAVRALLQKMGLEASRIIGIMMHSTDRDARRSELAKVNAFSWLSEFNHFQDCGNPYPGDASCGLPAHPAGVTPFDQTYLLHLGENLDGTEFEQATESVADYLQLDLLTLAGTFFDACRDATGPPNEAGSEASRPNLRSFGLSRRSAASRLFCDNFSATISRHVLGSWVGSDRNARPGASIEPGAAAARHDVNDAESIQLAQRLQLDPSAMAANARALVELQLGGEPSNFLFAWLEKLGISPHDCAGQLRAIGQIFGAGHDGVASGEVSICGARASAIVQPLAEKLRGELKRWAMRRIDSPGERLMRARRAVEWLNAHLRSTLAEIESRQSSITSQLNETNSEAKTLIMPDANGAFGTSHNDATGIAQRYFRLWLDRAALEAAQHVMSLLLSDVKSVSDEITALGREIDQIASAVARASAPCDAGMSADSSQRQSQAEIRLAAEITAKLPQIASQVDVQLQAEYIDAVGGLAKTIMQGGRPRAQLTAKLHELSRKAVDQALACVNVLANGNQSAGSTGDDLKSSLALATPAALEFGGRRRTLAILPREAAGATSQNAIAQRLNTPVTAIVGADSSFTVCVEADGLSLPHVALEFVERRRDRVEFAGRVHCRTDIAWLPLVSLATSSKPTGWSDEMMRGSQIENDMTKTLVM